MASSSDLSRGTRREVEEVRLPSVGVRHDFETVGGRRVGVVTHYSGRRELLVYDKADPDACRAVIELGDDDVRTLTDLLGTPHVVQSLSDLQQTVSGLAIDWVPVSGTSPYAGKTLGDTRMRTSTGVSAIAVVRGEETIPSPGPECPLHAGDTVVVVGTPDGIRDAAELLGPG